MVQKEADHQRKKVENQKEKSSGKATQGKYFFEFRHMPLQIFLSENSNRQINQFEYSGLNKEPVSLP